MGSGAGVEARIELGAVADSDTTAPWTRHDTGAVAAVALVAATARWLVSQAVPPAPPVFDMAEYWQRAVQIFETGALYPDVGRMPALPAALAAAFALAGEPSVAAARWLTIVAGTVSAVLTFVVARRIGERRPAWGAAAIVALYPSLLLHTALLTTETLVTVPMLAALLALTTGSPAAWLAAGAFAGAATLARPAAIAMLPAVLAAAAWRRQDGRRPAPGERPARAGLLIALGFAMVMLPWWLHGWRLHERFVPLDNTSGLNALIGNGPHATGRYRFSAVNRQQLELLEGLDPTTPEGSARAMTAAAAHVRAQPAEALRLIPAKLAFLLALEGNELAYLYSIGRFGDHDPGTVRLWGVAVMAAFPVVLAAGLGGLARRAGARAVAVRRAAVVYLAAAVALSAASFGEPRFHLPFVPVLAVLAAGLGASGAVQRWRLAGGAIVLLLLLPAWADQLRTYLGVLAALAAPGSWNRELPFDDLL